VQLDADLTSLSSGAEVHLKIINFMIFSTPSDGRNVDIVEGGGTHDVPLIAGHLQIPKTNDPYQLDIEVAPMTITLDLVTLTAIMAYLAPEDGESPVRPAVDQKVIVDRVDLATELHRLLMFKNHVLNVKCDRFAFTYPFKHHDVETSATFAFDRLIIGKKSNRLWSPTAPHINRTLWSISRLICSSLVTLNCLKDLILLSHFVSRFFKGVTMLNSSQQFVLEIFN
jgi:hypothetical protein